MICLSFLDRMDHPRSRGVYSRKCRRVSCAHRIIPARAGFTARGGSPQSRPADHPRSRGVYTVSTFRMHRDSGSSPLARGLQCLAQHPRSHLGIIPARAGFTLYVTVAGALGTDHPRSRGVYAPAGVTGRHALGSSPLARGLHDGLRDDRDGDRIIPARAGFTTRSLCRRSATRDHPRSRGVYHRLHDELHAALGSSPLARGLRVVNVL
mgnify:CR=1 FL=1